MTDSTFKDVILLISVLVGLATQVVTAVTATLVSYNSRHSLSSFFVRNTAEEQQVYLFTEQTNKLFYKEVSQ